VANPVDGMSETVEATDVADAVGAEREGPRPGDRVGRYVLGAVLGAGGMGRVFRARDPDLNRELAIKVLRRGPGSSSGGLEQRLMREAQAMARLNHTNLATVYDVGTVGGEVFIAFELIDGETLAAWSRRPARTAAERLAALRDAGRGLAAAHSAGVVHRDFKPDNVLVSRDGAVKVVDFGLARGVEQGADGAGDGSAARSDLPGASRDAMRLDLTATGSVLGTPAYMAPEQHQGGAADARADQFGFAVSAWELLYGDRPFRGATLGEIADAICAGVVPPAPEVAGVPPGVEVVLRRALAVAPADRFTDVTALLAALDRVVTRRPRWRRPLIAAAIVAVVGAGGIWAIVRWRETPTARQATTTPTTTRTVEQVDRDLLLARGGFNIAEDLYARGEFVAAARAFEKVYDTKRMPAFLYNAAASLERARDFCAAATMYRRYIDALGPLDSLDEKGREEAAEAELRHGKVAAACAEAPDVRAPASR
jgi:eukaryotic-like serine/threonine-protein kinase